MADRQYTRQLATIVSIDAVGFSRLMGLDEEGALVTFEERRNVIVDSCSAFGGRTFGAAGDSVMAEFGNPIEALRAAFDFQGKIVELNAPLQEDRRMRFRAGINTGDVIVREDNLYGDDVNIAARIRNSRRTMVWRFRKPPGITSKTKQPLRSPIWARSRSRISHCRYASSSPNVTARRA